MCYFTTRVEHYALKVYRTFSVGSLGGVFFFLMFPQHDIYLWLCSSSVVGAFMPLTLSHPAVPALCVYGAFVLHTAHSKMSYYFSFIFFQTDEGVEGLSSSASASLSLFSPFGSSKDSQLRLPLSLPIFYPSFRMQHHNQCYCSLAPPSPPSSICPLPPHLHPISSFLYSSSLSGSTPAICF